MVIKSWANYKVLGKVMGDQFLSHHSVRDVMKPSQHLGINFHSAAVYIGGCSSVCSHNRLPSEA